MVGYGVTGIGAAKGGGAGKGNGVTGIGAVKGGGAGEGNGVISGLKGGVFGVVEDDGGMFVGMVCGW